jgi:hypothetical protein
VALDTVAGLLEAVARLPEPARTRARARVTSALQLPAPSARAALGLLALDLAGEPSDAAATRLSA